MNENTKLFIQENAFENVVGEMAAIFPGGNEWIQPCLGHWWFGVLSQQAISWTNVDKDLWRSLESLAITNKLTEQAWSLRHG